MRRYWGLLVPVVLSITVSPLMAQSLVYSTVSSRANPAALEGATLSGLVYIFVPVQTGITRVVFSLDGVQTQTESTAPWDFKGGSASNANGWNTAVVPYGLHTITAAVTRSGTVISLTATFQIGAVIPPSVCGNGVVETGEQCDDHNTEDYDGCSSTCQLQPPVCGNGYLETGEQCDDGGTDPFDGCSALCEKEPPTNPTKLEFIPSPDHAALIPTTYTGSGQPVVSGYVFEVRKVGESSSFQVWNLLKPFPIDELIEVDVENYVMSLLAGDYEGVVIAVGPGGQAASPVSNVFWRRLPGPIPAKADAPVLVK